MEVFGQQWWLTFFSWYSRLKTRGQLWWATLPTLGQLWMGSSLYSSTRHPIRASHSEMQIRIRHFRSSLIRHDKICLETLGNYGDCQAFFNIRVSQSAGNDDGKLWTRPRLAPSFEVPVPLLLPNRLPPQVDGGMTRINFDTRLSKVNHSHALQSRCRLCILRWPSSACSQSGRDW